jgi:hypothetical protein
MMNIQNLQSSQPTFPSTSATARSAALRGWRAAPGEGTNTPDANFCTRHFTLSPSPSPGGRGEYSSSRRTPGPRSLLIRAVESSENFFALLFNPFIKVRQS